MNVLLIDHELYRLESLKRGLRIMGYRAFAASSVKEANACLGSDHTPIDLIITDCSTPLAVHSEFMETIEGRHGGIPVLMMTTSRKASHESHPLWPWCRGIIEKPFELDELARAIENIGKSAPIGKRPVNPAI